MIPIKIQCSCGQRYSFDVEPIDGHMPGAIACPACGAEGTGAANDYIAQNASAQPAVVAAPAAAPVARVRVKSNDPPQPSAPAVTATSLHTSTIRRATAQHTGQIDRTQAEFEAKAKIFWGDPRSQVIGYLMTQGYEAQEAAALVKTMLKERASTVRRKGLRKTMIGIAMIALPAMAVVGSLMVGFLSLTIIGLTGAVGLWGLWNVFDGLVLFFSPGSEGGDVADK